MEKKKKKILISLLAILLIACATAAGIVYYYLLYPQFHPARTVYVYIDRDDTADSIYNKVKTYGHPTTLTGFRWLAKYRQLEKTIHTGRYPIRPGDNAYHVYSRLSRGYQEPINLTIGSVRTLDRLARSVARQLMIDSAEIAAPLFDPAFQQQLGYNPETMPCLFIPETYQVYWDMSADDFFERMQKEHRKFWNAERLAKAQAIGMSPEEVCTHRSRTLHQPPAHRNAPSGRPYHQICPARLRTEKNLQRKPARRIALQHLYQHRAPSRTDTHPLSQRHRQRAQLHPPQLPVHVCQRRFLGHPQLCIQLYRPHGKCQKILESTERKKDFQVIL